MSDRKTNLILKHGELYGCDGDFARMVNDTVFLADEDKHVSQRYVDDYYGTELLYAIERSDRRGS